MKAIINMTRFLKEDKMTPPEISKDVSIGKIYFDIVLGNTVHRDAFVDLYRLSDSSPIEISEPFDYQGLFNHAEFSGKVRSYYQKNIERKYGLSSNQITIFPNHDIRISPSFTIEI